jgi:hypothetical protein
MPLISVTRLRVRSWRYLPQFTWQSLRSMRQAQRSTGFLGGKILRDANNTFWTMTLWNDEAAMSAFRIAGAHGKVMPNLLNWCDEATVAHWNQDGLEPPSWPQAYQRIVNQGRPSKVRHPSQAQRSNQIPAPQPDRFALTLKPKVRL